MARHWHNQAESMSSSPKNKCCICGNRRPDYTLHSFPTSKYRDIYDKWIDVIGRKDLAELPMEVVRKKYQVCETHFGRNDYFVSCQVRKLKKNSIPTVDCKKVDSPCTPRKDRHPNGITCTPQTVSYFAKSLEEKLLAEFRIKKEEMEGAQYIIRTTDKEKVPCFIKVEEMEDIRSTNNTEKMEEAPCIIKSEEMEDVQYSTSIEEIEAQYTVKGEEIEESPYIIDDDRETSWTNSEDAVQIEVIPDIFEYR